MLTEEHGFPGNKVSLVLPQETQQTLSAYRLHDTLILDLESPLELAAEPQPRSALSSWHCALQPTLGQCFLLFVVGSDDSDEYAHSLGHHCFGVPEPHATKAVLLGSPIWEFVQHGISHYVWIRSSRDFDGGAVTHIYNRLCCRAKIDYAVDQAAAAYQAGLADYQQIEQRLGEIHVLPPTTTPEERAQRIQGLEDHLSALPLHSHGLARAERDLDNHLLLISNSRANAQLSATSLPPNDSFLHSYFADDCAIYIRQIEHDLKVLSPGRRYADQAIEAIRAMVTLDSQKQQLELEKQETEREQKLRETLTILGTGLTISGLAASSRSRPTQKLLQDTRHWYRSDPSQPAIHLPAPVLWLTDIGVFSGIGVGAALLLYVCWSRLSKVCTKLFGIRR